MSRVYFKLLPEFPKPSGTAKEFQDWETKLQTEYPTRYHINDNIEKVVNHLFRFPCWRLRDFKNWFRYRLHPKYTFHKVTIKSLKPGYHDPRTIILHSAFYTFCSMMDRIYDGNSYVVWFYGENDENREYVSQEEIDRVNNRWAEMQALYKWWMLTRPNRRDVWDENNPAPKLPAEWGFMAPFNEDYKDTPEVKAWSAHSRLYNQQEGVWEQEDEDMFVRLVKIRPHLWD